MASIHKREKIWYVAWRDDKGKQHQKAVGPDKQAAKEEMFRKETETRRRKSGEIDQEDENRKDFAKMAISQHLDDWYTDMCNMGKDYYAHQNRIKIARILEAGNIARISELTHARVRAALIKLSARRGWRGNGTISCKLCTTILRRSCNSRYGSRLRNETQRIGSKASRCWRRARLSSDSVLEPDEARALLEATPEQPTRAGISGPDRLILYATALGTGYRLKELMSLTPESFQLDADPPNDRVPVKTDEEQEVGRESDQSGAGGLASTLA